MHIPDGFLNAPTLTVTTVLAITGVGMALRAVHANLPPRRVPLIGLTAAFIFAAQMLNFPVVAGTSGHLIGAALAAILLGPAAAVIAMTAVVLLQALMFADGGLTALGANVLNMAVIAPVVAYVVVSTIRRVGGDGLRTTLLAAGFAAWCSTVAASLACAVQLAASGVVAATTVVAAMGGVHMLIGLGEAIITMLVLSVVARARPELLSDAARSRGSLPGGALVALGIGCGVAVLLSPLASPLPDGLERVAEHLGFAGLAAASTAAPLADYALPGVDGHWPWLSTMMAGAIGAAVAFFVAWVVARSLTTPRRGTPRH